jgi:hypothetical protein
MPPLGLLTLAAMLPADFELTLVDLNVEPLADRLLSAAEVVFSSSMLIQKDSLQKLIGRCREHGVTHVAGRGGLQHGLPGPGNAGLCNPRRDG